MHDRAFDAALERFWASAPARPLAALKRSPNAVRALSLLVLAWPLAYILAGAKTELPVLFYPSLWAAWAAFVLFLNTHGRAVGARREHAVGRQEALAAAAGLLRSAGFEVTVLDWGLAARRGALDLVTGGVESEWRTFPLSVAVSAAAAGSATVLEARAVSRAWLWGVFFGGEVAHSLAATAAAVAALDGESLKAADRTVVLATRRFLGGGLATRINSALLGGLLVTAALLLAYGAVWSAGTRSVLEAERLRGRLDVVRDVLAGPSAPALARLARRLGPMEYTVWRGGRAESRMAWDRAGLPVPSTGEVALPDEVVARRTAAPALFAWRDLLVPGARAREFGQLRRAGGRLELYDVRAGPGGSLDGASLAVSASGWEAWEGAAAQAFAGLIVLLIGLLAAFAVLGTWLSQRLARPLLGVRDALRTITEGDFSVRIATERRDEVGQLERAVNKAAEELHRRELVKELFGKYMSRQVVERILKEPEKAPLTGEMREVSVLFADVRGFTKFSESRGPEEVVATLNEYFTMVVDVIAAHEGVLDKFIGDGLMAVFGSPVAEPGHALRAVSAALEIEAALQGFNLRRAERGLAPVAVGIGVNSGPVVSGNLGSLKRMEFTVIGDTVNLASRLEHQALTGQVLIGKTTYELCRDRVECESLGAVPIKGKKDPVEIWLAKGLKAV